MNRYLVLSAAALLAGISPAQAGGGGFRFGTIGGAPLCDTGEVFANGIAWAWQHAFLDCGGGVSNGQGLLARVEGIGKGALMSDNHTENYTSVGISYWLPKKLKDGNIWSLWVELSGTTSFKYESGVILTGGARAPAGAKDTLEKVRALIRARRSAGH
ncbi:MAG TPA: hypothetical protein VG819_11070 [Rhizomicrobium sp.]|jgi:hypothetical protein|nr:hypothetical protein [Rhizomicrobium sp.]